MSDFPEPTVGAVIFRSDGAVLLARSPKFFGKWVVPGGHVELGESLREAVEREVMEELGIKVKVERLVNVGDFIYDPCFHKKKHFVFLDFACRYISGEPKVDGRELTEYKWFTPAEALKADMEPYTRTAVEAHLSKAPCNYHEAGESE